METTGTKVYSTKTISTEGRTCTRSTVPSAEVVAAGRMSNTKAVTAAGSPHTATLG